MARWYVDLPDLRGRAYSVERLSRWARDGTLRPTDRVSRDGESWVEAATVPGLKFPIDQATQPELVRPVPADDATPVLREYANADRPAFSVGDRVSGYEVLSVLGSGAMGVVYAARQATLDRVVALKTIRVGRQNPETALARFLQEAQAVARLRHPNIVTAFDAGSHGDVAYYTMELLDGETLETRLKREPTCSEAIAWGVVRQAAAGLAHAAGQGVVHRDVKPGNLFLTPPPTGYPLPSGLPMVKVTDFGLARICLEEDAAAHRLTAAGMIVGTPLFMAPEQLSGEASDHRADIYALGVTAYEMIAGRAPFTGSTVWQLVQQKMEGTVAAIPGASPATMNLLRDMLATEPAKRIGSYEALLARIDRLLTVTPTETVAVRGPNRSAVADSSVRAPGAAPPRGKRRSLFWSGLALTIVILGAAVWWLTTRPPGPSMTPTGRAETLFRGTLGLDWQSLGGVWRTVRDAEKATVIAGTDGTIRRRIPPYEHHALTVTVDVDATAAAELHFGVEPYPVSAPSPATPRYVLRVSRSEGARLGRRASDDSPFEPLTSAVAVPSAESRADQSPYLEMRVERQGRWWYASFHRQPVGAVPDRGPPKVLEFRLKVEGGTARFDAAEVVELASPSGR